MLFERIAAMEGWQPEDALRRCQERSVYLTALLNGEMQGGAQLQHHDQAEDIQPVRGAAPPPVGAIIEAMRRTWRRTPQRPPGPTPPRSGQHVTSSSQHRPLSRRPVAAELFRGREAAAI